MFERLCSSAKRENFNHTPQILHRITHSTHRYETLKRALRKSQETILRPSLVCTFTGTGSESTSLERAMLRRHALRKLHERTRLDPLARAALIAAHDGKLWNDSLQRLTSLVDAMTLSVQMCT